MPKRAEVQLSSTNVEQTWTRRTGGRLTPVVEEGGGRGYADMHTQISGDREVHMVVVEYERSREETEGGDEGGKMMVVP